MSETEREARIDLAAAYRMACHHGLNEGVCNHFSLMLPGGSDRFLLIGYGTHWSEVRASTLVVIDLDWQCGRGRGRRGGDRDLSARPPPQGATGSALPDAHPSTPGAGARHDRGRPAGARKPERASLQPSHRLRPGVRGRRPCRKRGRPRGPCDGWRRHSFHGQSRRDGGGGDVAKTYDDLYYLERAADGSDPRHEHGSPAQADPGPRWRRKP